MFSAWLVIHQQPERSDYLAEGQTCKGARRHTVRFRAFLTSIYDARGIVPASGYVHQLQTSSLIDNLLNRPLFLVTLVTLNCREQGYSCGGLPGACTSCKFLP